MKIFKNKNIEKYLKTVTSKESLASTIIIPGKIYYSRNQVDWKESWKETFSEEEWEKMNTQLYNEQLEEMNRKISAYVEQDYLRRKRESELHYELTGDLDSFAIVEKEHEEYEKYLEKLEKDYEDVIEEEDTIDEDSEDIE